jgi:uncharacterized membrane protein HdeD (DUF308 family)
MSVNLNAPTPAIEAFGAPAEQPPPRWLAGVAGLLSIAVGIAALAWPGPTLLVVGVLFGAYFLMWGVALLIRGVATPGVSAGLRVLDILVALLALLVGLTLIVRPEASVATVAFVLGFWWTISGVMQFVHGVVSPIARAWNLIWGVIGAAAGIIILSSPEIALGTLVLIVSLALIAQGALELMVAFAPRGARA